MLDRRLSTVEDEHRKRTELGQATPVLQIADIDFQLAVGESSQMVEISAQTPLIDTERSQQASTIDETSIRNLPINRRDYLSFALLAPGISAR